MLQDLAFTVVLKQTSKQTRFVSMKVVVLLVLISLDQQTAEQLLLYVHLAKLLLFY